MLSGDIFRDIAEKPTEFAPATFAERGVAVDFTTPVLVQARVRPGRNNSLDVVLPNLAGGKGSYILAWKSLLQFVPVSLHDHSLHEAVLRLDRIDPWTVRSAVLTVAAQGLAGREAKQHAQILLEEDRQAALLTNFLLVMELLKRAGVAANDLIAAGSGGGISEARMRQALHGIAGMIGISAESLYQRVESLARLITPVGLPWSPEQGRMRRQLDDLERFAESLAAWRINDQSDAAEVADLAVAVARHTIGLARTALGEADAKSRDLLSAVRHWDTEGKVIGAGLSRLAWLLDGWSYIVMLWESSLAEPHERQRDVLLELARLIPVMPKEVAEWAACGLDQEMSVMQRKWVRANQDWRTGKIYRDAVVRNETLKARMR